MQWVVDVELGQEQDHRLPEWIGRNSNPSYVVWNCWLRKIYLPLWHEYVAQVFSTLPEESRGSYFPWFLQNPHRVAFCENVIPDQLTMLDDRLGKVSRASSALLTRLGTESYRAEISKLGTEPSWGPARLIRCQAEWAWTELCSLGSFSSGRCSSQINDSMRVKAILCATNLLD